MDRYFFRVEHELLRSTAFKSLGGSAIKVYLVLGLYSDFGTGWAFPSIRTIAAQAGLSRQTVLDALEEIVAAGLVAVQRETGKPNAYRLLQPTPPRPTGTRRKPSQSPREDRSRSFRGSPIRRSRFFRGRGVNRSRIFRGAVPVFRPPRPRG